MTTDNRTNEPTEAQVEAAAKAIADCHNPGMFEKYPENWRIEARAALVAAAAVPDAATELRTERDAALAAIGRVRAVADDWASDEDAKGLHFDLLAALDGAPEPEWEVQYGRRNRETGALHWLTGDPRDDWWHENQDRYEHVKRYTSPPLPVEGESK